MSGLYLNKIDKFYILTLVLLFTLLFFLICKFFPILRKKLCKSRFLNREVLHEDIYSSGDYIGTDLLLPTTVSTHLTRSSVSVGLELSLVGRLEGCVLVTEEMPPAFEVISKVEKSLNKRNIILGPTLDNYAEEVMALDPELVEEVDADFSIREAMVLHVLSPDGSSSRMMIDEFTRVFDILLQNRKFCNRRSVDTLYIPLPFRRDHEKRVVGVSKPLDSIDISHIHSFAEALTFASANYSNAACTLLQALDLAEIRICCQNSEVFAAAHREFLAIAAVYQTDGLMHCK